MKSNLAVSRGRLLEEPSHGATLKKTFLSWKSYPVTYYKHPTQLLLYYGIRHCSVLRSWHDMCNNDVGRAALGVSWNIVRIGYQHLQEAIPYAVVGLSFEAKIIITKI